jgi:hypothetical protein
VDLTLTHAHMLGVTPNSGWDCFMKLSLIAFASTLALVATAAHAGAVVVPGTADPFLAGAPSGGSVDFNGVIDANTDYAPAESPVGIFVKSGGTLLVSAVNDPILGSVGNCPGCTSGSPAGGAAINSTPFTTTGFTALVSGYPAPLPINSLIGLFNGPSPSVFEIGDGGSFTVPIGATELYLATVDGYQWNNNVGAYDVTLSGSAVPEPAAWATMLLGAAMIGAGLRLGRKNDMALTVA